MSQTLYNGIPFVPENTIDPAAGLNEALREMDAREQVFVLTAGSNSPPANPNEGERHIVGSSPTGAWAGKAHQIASFENGAWVFRNIRQAACEADQTLRIRFGNTWKTFNGS